MKRFFFSLLAAATIASATQVTTLQLTDVGNGTNQGGFYVGPYDVSINGGPKVPALCVDFAHDSNIGDVWTANLANLGSDSLTTTYHSTGKQGYLAASYLFSQITAPGVTAQQQIDLQHAAWFIFAPNGGFDMSDQATQDYNAAIAHASSQNPYAYQIVSDVNRHEQEFLIAAPVPEPASLALLGLALGGAGLVNRLRRKSTRL